MIEIKDENDGISIKITVLPNASKTMIVGIIDGIVKIKLSAPPVDGKANKEIILFFSKFFDVPKSKISITKGEKNKLKTLYIKGNKLLLQDKIKNTTF